MADEPKVSRVSIPLKRTGGLPAEGIYRCVIRQVVLKEGPAGPYMSCECGIDDKDHPVESGKTFYTNLSLSPKATWKMEEALDALGAPTEGEITDTGWFHGKRFYAMLTHREWDGRKNLQLDTWIAREAVKDALAKWREESAERLAAEKERRAKAIAEAAELAPDADEDEIPEDPDPEPEQELDEALDDLWDD